MGYAFGMRHRNPDAASIAALLERARTIAVVGLSDDPGRPSYRVARAMRDYGYRIVPVNPALTRWEGERAFPTLAAAVRPGTRRGHRHRRRVPPTRARRAIVEDCLRLKLPALWLQLDVIDEAAAARAQSAGMTVIMDRCILVERRALRA